MKSLFSFGKEDRTGKAPLPYPVPPCPKRKGSSGKPTPPYPLPKAPKNALIKGTMIGIDLDSTLNHLDKAWIKWINDNHDKDLKIENWLSWGIHKYTKAGKEIYDFLSLPGSFLDLEVQEDSVRVVERLSKLHSIFIVTHCTDFIACPDKGKWIQKHFPFIPKENIIFCSKKHLVNVDILIDDGAHNFDEFNGTPLLYDQPWNTFAKNLDKNRVKGWKSIEKWMEDNRYLPKENQNNV